MFHRSVVIASVDFSPIVRFIRPRALRRFHAKTFLLFVISLASILSLSVKFSPSKASGIADNSTDVITSSVDRNADAQTASTSPIVIGAGDISSCTNDNDLMTARLIQSIFASGATGKVITLGDNVYEEGTPAQFADCFNPTWGLFLNRIKPAIGNHEYLTTNASGYFNYFGSRAGNPQKGYYSYNLGEWHIVVINSNCSKVGGCQIGSPQERWLRTDLAANPRYCTLAYWHHPRFSSGEFGDYTSLTPIWQALYDYNADVVLSGHDHDYERFAPQSPSGAWDSLRGIREFVVGTGGKNHTSITHVAHNSEVRNDTTFGVLRLTLNARSYNWKFIPMPGQTFTDSGSNTCH